MDSHSAAFLPVSTSVSSSGKWGWRPHPHVVGEDQARSCMALGTESASVGQGQRTGGRMTGGKWFVLPRVWRLPRILPATSSLSSRCGTCLAASFLKGESVVGVSARVQASPPNNGKSGGQRRPHRIRRLSSNATCRHLVSREASRPRVTEKPGGSASEHEPGPRVESSP